MSGALRLEFGFDRRLFPRALMAFWFSAVPRSSLRFRLVFWMLVWVAVLAGVVAAGALRLPPSVAWAIAAGVVALWIIGLQRVRMARFYRALSAHWDKVGPMAIEFDDDGLVVTQTGSRMAFSWGVVDAVARARGGTVLRIGMTMIAVPDTALPENLSPGEFRARIANWRQP